MGISSEGAGRIASSPHVNVHSDARLVHSWAFVVQQAPEARSNSGTVAEADDMPWDHSRQGRVYQVGEGEQGMGYVVWVSLPFPSSRVLD